MKYLLLFFILIISCESNSEISEIQNPRNVNILSLGDSYTIGEGVCEDCNFPTQLVDSLNHLNNRDSFNANIIAQTGWSTSSLINNLDISSLPKYDLVTLLIGVNNQFWGLPFETYKNEFIDLINISTLLTKSNDLSDLIIISIPDYAYTPYAQSFTQGLRDEISEEIDIYNNYAQNYCYQNEISYVNITDISRLGLDNPELVSSDNLHLSEIAYRLFVERILPIVEQKIYY